MGEQKKVFVDLFSGAGGFGLGLKLAGVKPVLSIEVDPFAIQTLKANSTHPVIQADLSVCSTKEYIYRSVTSRVDILIGGPPCQGFSSAASNRVKKFDPRNELVFQFLEWVRHLEPSIFVIENVLGIEKKVDHEGNKIYDKIHTIARKLGYNVEIWKLNAADYGVPQTRIRAFIVGVKGTNSKITKPIPTHVDHNAITTPLFDSFKQPEKSYVTVGDAILDLPYIEAKGGGEVIDYDFQQCTKTLTDYQKWARESSDRVYNHAAMHHTDRLIGRYQHFIDGNTNSMPEELRVRARNGNGELSSTPYNSNYRYLDPNKPSYTIPASFYSSFVHPSIPRNITAREAARLQSFPDWYVFKGKRTLVSKSLLKRKGKIDQIGLSQYNQVGNAVPPLLAKAVGKAILDEL